MLLIFQFSKSVSVKKRRKKERGVLGARVFSRSDRSKNITHTKARPAASRRQSKPPTNKSPPLSLHSFSLHRGYGQYSAESLGSAFQALPPCVALQLGHPKLSGSQLTPDVQNGQIAQFDEDTTHYFWGSQN